MSEITFSPLTDPGSQLLDQLQTEAQLYPFRTTEDGSRSYALGADTVQLAGLDAMLDGIEPGWREHLTKAA